MTRLSTRQRELLNTPGELTNQIIDADLNTLLDIKDVSIADDAAIDGTKILPDFGNQAIYTQGNLFEITGINPKIKFTETDAFNKSWYFIADGSSLSVSENNTSTIHLNIQPGGNIGLGTTAPQEKLDISGNIKASGDAFIYGNVGIGTNDPQTNLHIASTGSARVRLQDLDGTNQYSDILHNGSALYLTARNDEAKGRVIFRGTDGTTTTEYARFEPNGRFGIGTITPSNKLTVEGDTDITGKLGIGTASPTEELHIFASMPTIRLQDSDGTNQFTSIYHASTAFIIDARNSTSNGPIVFRGVNGTTTTEYARFTDIGRLGIGTNSPTEKLHVAGNGLFTGNVGIGTGSPDVSLHINTSNPAIRLQDSDGTNQYTTIYQSGASLIYDMRNDNDNGYIRFRAYNGSTASERMRIATNGNVGINETSPTEKLDVGGNINSQGRVYAEIATDVKRDLSDAMSIEDITSVAPTLDLDFSSPDRFDSNITFARNSTATYYDGKTVAKAEENLILGSEDFANNSYWTSGGYPVTVSSNVTIAPDGTTTADSMAETTDDAGHGRYTDNGIFRTVSGVTYVQSIFLKKGDGATAPDVVQLNWRSAGFSTVVLANFNISTGTVVGGDTDKATITSVGNGWYRCTLQNTATSTASNAGMSVAFCNNNPSANKAPTYVGQTTSNVFVWGAQLEQRDAATAYTKTTDQPITKYIPKLMTAAANEPRIDFDPITKEVKGLLIEESRENLLPYSEAFDNAAWGKGLITVEANAAIAPDGTLSADKIIPTNVSGIHNIQDNIAVSTGVTYTQSVYVKAGELGRFSLRENTEDQYGVVVNLLADPPTALANGSSSTNVGIEHVGNEWYRVWVDAQMTSSTSLGWEIRLYQNDGNATYTGDGYSGIYIWGAQIEEGAFPTSYIPTSGAAVTRQADNASMTGDAFSSWWSGSEGSIYSEHNFLTDTPDDYSYIFRVDDGTDGNRIMVRRPHSNNLQALALIGGTLTSDIYRQFVQQGKTVFAFKEDSFAFTTNADGLGSDSSGNMPKNLTTLRIGSGTVNFLSNLNGHIKRLTYWPKRLANDTLKEITSLKSGFNIPSNPVIQTAKGDVRVFNDLLVDRNLGIGTKNPQTNLHIASTASARVRVQDLDGTNLYSDFIHNGGALYIKARNGNGNPYIIFQGTNGTADTEYARFTSSGRFGINNTNPNRQLDIIGNGIQIKSVEDVIANNYVAMYHNANSTVDYGLQFRHYQGNDGSSDATIAIGGSGSSAGRILFQSNNNTNVTILANGDVGIGIDPTEKLDVAGNVKAKGTGSTASTQVLTLTNSVNVNMFTINNDGTFNGRYLGIEETTGSTRLGKDTAPNATDDRWTAVGSGAGQSITTGRYWTAVGERAGNLNTDGDDWTALGFVAGRANTTGFNWTALGSRAGTNNKDGRDWTAVGMSAGNDSNTGSYWTAVGSRAGYNNTTGNSWVAVGYFSGYDSISGSNWVAVGPSAGSDNTSGSYWVAIGDGAGRKNTTGNNWEAIGRYAGGNNLTGSEWIAIGEQAGRYIKDTYSDPLQYFTRSIYIGADTKGTNGTEVSPTENEIVIGVGAWGNGSNTVTIGNSSVTDNYFNGNGIFTGTLTEQSSIVHKTNISTLQSSLDIISSLQGVKYDKVDGSRRGEIGLIAEDVEAHLPEVVRKDENGNPQAIEYTRIVPLLIESIKELKAEIEILKNS